MIQGIINKVIPFSSVDGPGNRTVIFLQGCNFNCIYCHTPETINHCENCGKCVSMCPVQMLKKEDGEVAWDKDECTECNACTEICEHSSSPKVMNLTADKILEGIAPYKGFIQGITVSGGECTLQEAFLVDLFKKAKAMGLTCYMDTNGSNDFEVMSELLDLTDGVMLDVKVWDENTHMQYIGATNVVVLKNLRYLLEKKKLYEVRTVVVPEAFDNQETVKQVAKVIGESDVRYKLIKYRPLGVREASKCFRAPSTRVMEKLEELAIQNGCNKVTSI